MGDDEVADVDNPEEGGGDGGGEVSSHARAAALATVTEKQRATLGRALVTLVKMTHARGFDVVEVAGQACGPEEGGKEAPSSSWAGALERALADCDDPDRAATAESTKEVLVLGRVPEGGPRKGTACAAQGTPPGAEMAVVCIANGKVQEVREALDLLTGALDRVVTVILVSRCSLTSFTRKYINALREPSVDFFPLEQLQRCVVEHRLVPPHVPLTQEEATRARSLYRNIIFSRLQAKDPVARFYGFVPGQLVFIYETWGRRQPVPCIFEVVAAT